MIKTIIIVALSFSSVAFAKKADCSDKARNYTYKIPKKCPWVEIKAWGGGGGGQGKHGLGGAYTMSDFEIPADGVLQIHIGAGGKAGQDGETTIVNYGQSQLVIARGGEAAEENSNAAFPGFQRGMSHFDYPKDANAAGASDPTYVKANKGLPAGKTYAHGADGEGMCGLVVFKCREKDKEEKKK